MGSGSWLIGFMLFQPGYYELGAGLLFDRCRNSLSADMTIKPDAISARAIAC
jgi:hypothetical protein